MNAERPFHRFVYLDKIRGGDENVLEENESVYFACKSIL
jgi:hypothetical protein